MYQLVIKNGEVIATHEMHTDVADKYPGCEIISYPTCPSSTELGYGPDPRTAQEKREAYRDKRRLEYPTMVDQLDMIYHDAMNGTTTWTDAITVVKTRHPRPEEITRERT
jgi:hypothetical protein